MDIDLKAKQLADMANQCCHRTDGYEQDIYCAMKQAMNDVRCETIEKCASIAEVNYSRCGINQGNVSAEKIRGLK